MAAGIGAAGSVVFLWRASQRPSVLLLVVMACWVLAPFVIMAGATAVSNNWPRAVRTTLHAATLILTLGTLAIYADDARGHRKPQAAFVFVAVPPAAVSLLTAALLTAAFFSRTSRTSRTS